MRRHSQSFLIYLIFGAIIVVFAINFGPGSGSCMGPGGSHWAATVDGEVIPQKDFALIYSRRLDVLRRNAQRSGADFTPEMAERFGLRQQVLDQLIERTLLTQAAKRHGLGVSDAELLTYLQEQYGVKDVSFSDYRGWVNRTFQKSVPRFEAEARDEILAQRIAQVVTDNLSISDAELKESYLREHNRAMVSYVRFDPAQMGAQPPSAEAIAALLAEDMAAVEARYAQDTFMYRTPKEVRARQIVRTLPADASAAQVQQARELLQQLHERFEAGEDFAALAKAYSQDEATAKNGGDMGYFKRGQQPSALEEAVFALQTNAITEQPVRTAVGLHLVQVTDIKPPARKALDEVKEEVAKAVLMDRAREAEAQRAAEAFLAQLKAGKSLEQLTISEDKAREELTPGGPAALRRAQSKPPVRWETPWILKSQEAIPRIGASDELHKAIFSLSAETPLPDKAYKVGRAFFVVVLKDRETPDLSQFEAQIGTLREQELGQKRFRVLREWIADLRKNAEVEINPVVVPNATDSAA